MHLYIPGNKFLNSTGSSNDLYGRNLGHAMLSNMLPGLIASTCQSIHYLPESCAVGMPGFPSLCYACGNNHKRVSPMEPSRPQPLALITIWGVGRTSLFVTLSSTLPVFKSLVIIITVITVNLLSERSLS